MIEREHEHCTLPDPARVARLDDGLHAAVCITPDGSEALWLLVDDGDDEPAGCACHRCAPHEQAGPLPLAVRTRAGLDAPRCGAPTRTTGWPCMQPVEREGLRCRWHREVAR